MKPSIPSQEFEVTSSYYIDRRAQPNGDHELHDRSRCPKETFPPTRFVDYLGDYASGQEALQAGRKMYGRVNGCIWCTPDLYVCGVELETI